MFGPRLRVERQSQAGECGLACLTMIAGYHGFHTDLITLRQRFPISERGARLPDLLHAAAGLGLEGEAFRLRASGLAQLKKPAMLHWKGNHFVVLKAAGKKGVVVLDPALGLRRYSVAEAAHLFSGVAIELSRRADFKEGRDESHLSLGQVVGSGRAFIAPLAKALALSLLIQVMLLAAPLFLQIAVDRSGRFRGLPLDLVALGFGAIVLLRGLSIWARSYLTRRASNVLGTQIVGELFAHWIRLPLDWFQRRQVGDIVSRFRSAQPVRDLLADEVIVALSDIVSAGVSAVMLAIYSLRLAAIVLVGMVLTVIIRAAFYARVKEQEELSISAAAREQSSFLETARAIQTIKASANELGRQDRWQERHDEMLIEQSNARELNNGISTASEIIRALAFIAVVYYGIHMVGQHALTLGMLYAALTYKGQTEDRVQSLVEFSFKWISMRLHFDRLAEISLAQVEPFKPVAEDAPIGRHIDGELEVRGLGFRYSPTDPYVLKDVDLHVTRGSFVAITGPSGCGKTTLLKIMAGLAAQTEGEILIDGAVLNAEDLQDYRRQIAVVLQDDMLLAGTLLENVTMFAENPDHHLAEQCCRLAAIHDDIKALPLGYETMSGDMGSTLSGGQKQRLFLARALYRRPQILFMDEGTSALDLRTEHRINRALKRLQITRIVVAHRPDTIKAADWVLTLAVAEQPAAAEGPPATQADEARADTQAAAA